MKKVLLTLSALFLTFCAFGEDVVGSYTASEVEWTIEASEKNGNLSIFIEVLGEYKWDEVFINIDGDTAIEEFRTSLMAMQLKFAEWRDIAIKNNVNELSKKMDIIFPNCEIYWKGSDQWYSTYRRNHLQPLFMISDGDMCVGFGGKAIYWDNDYITQQWYAIFLSVDEIKSLYNATDPYKIRKALNAVSNTEDLFK